MGKPDRPRHQLWSFAYLAVRRVLSLALLVLRTSGSKEIEILVLHHELEILGRNQPRPPLDAADRAWLAALRRLLGSVVDHGMKHASRSTLRHTGYMGPCTFCGTTSGKFAVEHVIPKWIRTLLAASAPLKVYAGEESEPDPRHQIRQLLHLSITVSEVICERCNNEFLGGFEKAAAPCLGPMIKTAKSAMLNRTQQELIATWATKTVWLLELAARQMFPEGWRVPGYVATQPEFAYFWAEKKPPPRALVWLGCWDCQSRTPLMYQPAMATVPTADGTELVGHLTTLAIGYVALQVFSVDFVAADVHGAALWNTQAPAALNPGLTRIWPVLKPNVEWPRAMFAREDWQALVTWDGALRPPR